MYMDRTAAYAVAVRTSEYDLPPEILDDLVAQVTSRAMDGTNFGEDAKRGRTKETSRDYGYMEDD